MNTQFTELPFRVSDFFGSPLRNTFHPTRLTLCIHTPPAEVLKMVPLQTENRLTQQNQICWGIKVIWELVTCTLILFSSPDSYNTAGSRLNAAISSFTPFFSLKAVVYPKLLWGAYFMIKVVSNRINKAQNFFALQTIGAEFDVSSWWRWGLFWWYICFVWKLNTNGDACSL